EVHGRLQLEADEEADRLVLDPGDQAQDVVPAAEPPAKLIQVARRAKDLVVHLGDDGEFFGTNSFDYGVSHGGSPSNRAFEGLLSSVPGTGHYRSGRYSEAISSCHDGTFQLVSVSISSGSRSSSSASPPASATTSSSGGSTGSSTGARFWRDRPRPRRPERERFSGSASASASAFSAMASSASTYSV